MHSNIQYSRGDMDTTGVTGVKYVTFCQQDHQLDHMATESRHFIKTMAYAEPENDAALERSQIYEENPSHKLFLCN